MSSLPSPTHPLGAASGLTSPFRVSDLYSSVSSTIHPSQALRRGSSPSDTSSVSGLNFSRLETASSSTTSSVFGGNDSTGPSTPYRSGSVSRSNSQRDPTQKHARRRSSPIKLTNRHQRKLSNAERKAICVFHLTHPGMKQDDIGAHFGYERSTISKTLKFKEKYLAMDSDDEADLCEEGSQSGSQSQNAQNALYASSPSPFDYGEQDHATPQPSPGLVPSSSSVSSLVSLNSSVSSDHAAPYVGKSHGRFPHIDSALLTWAREQAARGSSLSDSVLQRQARAIARASGDNKFKASATWLDGFKMRAGITAGQFCEGFGSKAAAAAAAQHALSFSSPPSSAMSSSTHLPRALSPPVEEENEDDDAGQTTLRAEEPEEEHANQQQEQQVATRRSKRNLGSKTVRCLANAKSTLGAFADGLIRSSSPAAPSPSGRPHGNDLQSSTSTIAGGSFGDLSMDSEATPTHSAAHSRDTTYGAETSLAQPYSYSPTAPVPPASATPSRGASRPELLYLPSHDGYSPTDASAQYLHAFEFPGSHGRTQAPHERAANFAGGGLSSSSSSASLAGFDNPGLGMSVPHGISPATSVQLHRRSGSTASTTSVYSGLTAFSSQNPGTPLTSSISGSYRDGQSNACSLPGTPANAQASYFASEQAQLQNSLLSTGRIVHSTPTSVYSPASSGSAQQQQTQTYHHQQQNSTSHTRYPQHSYPSMADSQGSSSQSQSLRRSTISGGLPFNASLRASTNSNASSAAMTPSLSLSSSSLRSPGHPVTLEQAFSSLEIALEYLSTRAGQDYVSPKDLVVLADLKGKMERARGSSPPSLDAVASAPATPSGLGPSSSNAMQIQQQLHSPFVALPGSGNVASLDRVAKQQRVRLSRTQSAGSVLTMGGMSAAPAAASAGVSTRRSGSRPAAVPR